MKVLVIGQGGREHALCWALSTSPLLDQLFVVPGNDGMDALAECVPIASNDIDGLVGVAKRIEADLVVVGPEGPLVAGLVDHLKEAGIAAFGPEATAARLESSKSFAKAICAQAGVSTASYTFFTYKEHEAARAYLSSLEPPIVIKADGLAAGKGVVIANSHVEAVEAVDSMLCADRFGEAGHQILIEDTLAGREVSVFALVSGETVIPLGSAQDYKRLYDGHLGPNTGGMGAIAPALDEVEMDIIIEQVMRPIARVLAKQGLVYRGVLYAGLMINEAGPQVLEFNVRFGDPECQALMFAMNSDLLPSLIATVQDDLHHFVLQAQKKTAICVVMAAKGYPNASARGEIIEGLEALPQGPDQIVFHAGTRRINGIWHAVGGRVLGVTARSDYLDKARALAYATIDHITWPEGIYRHDIGL